MKETNKKKKRFGFFFILLNPLFFRLSEGCLTSFDMTLSIRTLIMSWLKHYPVRSSPLTFFELVLFYLPCRVLGLFILPFTPLNWSFFVYCTINPFPLFFFSPICSRPPNSPQFPQCFQLTRKYKANRFNILPFTSLCSSCSLHDFRRRPPSVFLMLTH
jgi:hypothetical protein